MAMPPIEFHVSMFRDERDQARSQYVLLFLMEALCRVNQSLLRHQDGLVARGLTREKFPRLYAAGVHYEREPPGQEEWPDIVNILAKTGQEFPGAWADCEDLSCWRVAELRESDRHIENGKIVGGGVKARPFAKWRRGPEGQFNYHALVLLPDGRLEDPSLTLGMGREKAFATAGIAERLKSGEAKPVIQYAKKPDVMVIDPDHPTGFATRTDPSGLIGRLRPAGVADVSGKMSGHGPGIRWKPSDSRFRRRPDVLHMLNTAREDLLASTGLGYSDDLVNEALSLNTDLDDESLSIGQSEETAPAGPAPDEPDPYQLETAPGQVYARDTTKTTSYADHTASPPTLSSEELNEIRKRLMMIEARLAPRPGKAELYPVSLAKRSVRNEVKFMLNRLASSVIP